MNSRTRMLLAGMVLVGIVAVGDQLGLLESIEKWGSEHESSIAKVKKQIEMADGIILKGAEASDKLLALEERSLPYNSELARSQYQDWLSSLVEENQLSQSTVEVSQPVSVTITDQGKPREVYKRYSFSMSATGTLDQLTKCIFDFYQGAHLQKINTINLTPTASALFTVSITGEALGLTTCQRESELATKKSNRLAFDEISDYHGIVRRNIFSREIGSTLKLVKLSSVTFDKSGLPEAWFKVGEDQSTNKLLRGEKLTVSVHQVEVIDIQPKSVLVDVDGTVALLPLGKSLHDVLPASVAAVSQSTSRN